MNIREIIDAERWDLKLKDGWWAKQHNVCLDRILATIEEPINTLNQRQAETAKVIECLEEKLKVKTDYVHRLLDKMASLRATVTPKNGRCSCGEYCLTVFGNYNNFCRKCGAKLKWV